MRWTDAALQAEVMMLARTAIMVPVDPAKAVAVGTTQKLLFGLTAPPSSAVSPALRRPRLTRAAPNISHRPTESAHRADRLARSR